MNEVEGGGSLAVRSAKEKSFRQYYVKESVIMTVFIIPVFDATVVFEGNELFKGRGSADQWAQKLAIEIGGATTVRKIGTGWAICGSADGKDCVWGIYGQRLKRIN